MSFGYEELTDALTLVGFAGFPGYSAYWVRHQLRAQGGRRMWIGMLAFVAWCVATYVCFLRLMFGCMGGNCAGRVSPFLEYSVAYALITAVLIAVMHTCRAKPDASVESADQSADVRVGDR